MGQLEGNDLHSFMYGSESADKLKRFQEGLNQIEDKYSDFFKSRKAKTNPDEEDKLSYHYLMIFNYQTVFGFDKNSDLPDYIKKECIDLFNTIYN